MTTTGRLIAVTLTCCVLTATARADSNSLEEAKKKIHEKLSSYKSLQYKLEMSGEQSSADFTMKMTARQEAFFVNKGEKVLARTETSTSTTQKIAGKEHTFESRSLDICDGEYSYSVVEQMGQKAAMKRKADFSGENSPFNGMGIFKQMDESFEVKRLPDETVDGKPAYVFEFIMKPGPEVDASIRSLSYFDKATGISVKGVSIDGDGKVMRTSVTKDIKIDADISPDKFVFKAPPDVELQDMTKEPEFDRP